MCKVGSRACGGYVLHTFLISLFLLFLTGLDRCDEELGCVCKDGFDCEGGTQIIDFASLTGASADGGDSSSHTQVGKLGDG